MMGHGMMGHGGMDPMEHGVEDHGEMKHEAPSMPMDSKSSDHQMPMDPDQHERHMQKGSDSSHAMMGVSILF